MEVAYHRVGGYRLRVAVTEPAGAARTPLLLFNGIGASLELLEPLTTRLDGVRTITFDLPGVGQSDPSWLPRRPSGLARLARDLLNELDEPVADILGVSWGGMLAQQFAYQYPAMCRRLVLAATSAGQLMVPASPEVLLHMMSPGRYFSSGYLRRIAGTVYGGDFRHDDELARRYAEHMSPPSPVGYLHQLLALTGWTSLFWLHRLRQPTLVMAGRDDPVVPKINAQILASRIPDSRLHYFDCGHLFLFTRTEEAVAVLQGFLGDSGELDRGR